MPLPVRARVERQVALCDDTSNRRRGGKFRRRRHHERRRHRHVAAFVCESTTLGVSRRHGKVAQRLVAAQLRR